MTDHDPLCPASFASARIIEPDCSCYLIRKARTDERERIAKAIEKKADTYFELEYRWVAQDAAKLARSSNDK